MFDVAYSSGALRLSRRAARLNCKQELTCLAAGPMPSLAPPSLFSYVVSQATGVQAVRARLLSSAPSLEVEDAEDVETADMRSLSSSSSSRAASSTAHSRATCESCTQLETDFAGAVLFVESYQGPHRILTQENSSPRRTSTPTTSRRRWGPARLQRHPQDSASWSCPNGVWLVLCCCRWHSKVGCLRRICGV